MTILIYDVGSFCDRKHKAVKKYNGREAMVKEKIKSLEELMETLEKRVKNIINKFEELSETMKAIVEENIKSLEDICDTVIQRVQPMQNLEEVYEACTKVWKCYK